MAGVRRLIGGPCVEWIHVNAYGRRYRRCGRGNILDLDAMRKMGAWTAKE